MQSFEFEPANEGSTDADVNIYLPDDSSHEEIEETEENPIIGTRFKIILFWLLWLIYGTCFYYHYDNFTLGQSFYMCISVGYSIGWSFPVERDDWSYLFSTFYILMGSSAVAAALGYFVNTIVEDNSNWYNKHITEVKYEEDMKSTSMFVRVNAFVSANWTKFRSIIIWILWVFWAIIWSMFYGPKWSFIPALYWAISSLSTGGLLAIPRESPDSSYWVTGVFAAFGVPIMGFAMAQVASLFMKQETHEEIIKKIHTPITEEEIEMLGRFGLDKGNGVIALNEFMILQVIRCANVKPHLLLEIVAYFHSIDDSKNGQITRDTLTAKMGAQHNINRNSKMVTKKKRSNIRKKLMCC